MSNIESNIERYLDNDIDIQGVNNLFDLFAEVAHCDEHSIHLPERTIDDLFWTHQF